MSEEKDFFKKCFNVVAGMEAKNENEIIAKEVVLDEVENLQQENKQLKDNWNKLKEWLNAFHRYSEFEQWQIVNKMQEIEESE